MSLTSLTSRDTVTIQRNTPTKDATAGKVTGWTGNRGALPTSLTCRAQPLTVQQQLRLGVNADKTMWQFFFTTDPQVDTQDRFTFTQNTVSHTVPMSGRARDLDGQGRAWQVMGEEDFGET